MAFNQRKKLFTILAFVGVLLFLTIYLILEYRTQNLEELKKDFYAEIERAETLRNAQLDSAWHCANGAKLMIENESSLELENKLVTLLLSEIDFFRSGANDGLYETVADCESWFRKRKYRDETFRANFLRLEIKSFSTGNQQVAEDVDQLIRTANATGSNAAKAKAYYFKMDQRDIAGKWEDDVHILDSARMFAIRSNDSVLISKILITSVLAQNGTQASKDSTFLSLREAEKWDLPELKCVSYTNMALRFSTGRRLDTALFYLEKGLLEADQWGSKLHKLYTANGIAKAYIYVQDVDSVLKYAEIALGLARELNNREFERDLLLDIASGWTRKENPTKAMDLGMQAMAIANKYGSKLAVFKTRQFILGFSYNTKRFDEVDRITNEMLIAQEVEERNQVNDINTARIYYMKGQAKYFQKDFDSALYF